jgi:S-adenosylmethionine:tRNA ribosyltransferase-isomerase
MSLEDYDYHLPEHLIAQQPLKDRTASRLLCYLNKSIDHSYFKNLTNYLNANDLLVFNDTRVIPARIYAYKSTGGRVEIFIESIVSNSHAKARVSNSKNLQCGDYLKINETIKVLIVSQQKEFYELEFSSEINFCLESYGHTPLPPYIRRKANEEDRYRYQTVYAEHDGAVAAPTAGLHFDQDIMQSLEDKRINTGFLTLHVGAGTFMPIRSQIIEQHVMHKEHINVTEELCDLIHKTKSSGGRVIAVGTTCVRALETAAQKDKLLPYKGYTELFVYPGYDFQVVDAMITNFHQPRSSLYVLIAAFIGLDTVKAIYEAAISREYRFFSYGDVMFIKKGHK